MFAHLLSKPVIDSAYDFIIEKERLQDDEQKIRLFNNRREVMF
jgi:hypothetical protein